MDLFLKIIPQYAGKSVLDFECPNFPSTVRYIIAEMNGSLCNSLKLGFIILWHVMLIKAFDFNMQLFCQLKHFLTYILSSVQLLQLGRKCYHGNTSAVATSSQPQLSLEKQLKISKPLSVKYSGSASDLHILLPQGVIYKDSWISLNYRYSYTKS